MEVKLLKPFTPKVGPTIPVGTYPAVKDQNGKFRLSVGSVCGANPDTVQIVCHFRDLEFPNMTVTPYRLVSFRYETPEHPRLPLIFELTQRLHPKHEFGHYCWVLTDLDGMPLAVGQSFGGVVDAMTQKEADAMGARVMAEYVENCKFEREKG